MARHLLSFMTLSDVKVFYLIKYKVISITKYYKTDISKPEIKKELDTLVLLVESRVAASRPSINTPTAAWLH